MNLYNTAERLVEVKENHSTIAKYQYDPFGRRIGKTVNGQTTYFHYSDEGVVAEYDQNGAVIKTYGWEPQGLWGTNPLWQAEQNVFYFFHNDHLGTSQRLTDKDGKLAWAMQSEAFGKTTPKTNNSTINNLRFPGQYFDEETSNHYNYFRDYSPNLGRYVQSDPLGIQAGVNIYTYARNNALVKFDIQGLETCGSGRAEPIIPDNPLGFPFSDCCQKHDDCYGDCDTPSKEFCDRNFLSCMGGKCLRYIFMVQVYSICQSVAGAYYGAVAAFGQGPFNRAQEKCREPCELPPIFTGVP